MDLVKLGSKSILVPTPGQTEQEYLAAELLQNNIALSFPQDHFSLKQSIAAAKAFPFVQWEDPDFLIFRAAITTLIQEKIDERASSLEGLPG